MKIRATTIEQLTNDEIAAWSAIQRSEPELASPFFRPEFTQAVTAVRRNVEVAVLEEDGRPIGFLPYQRSQWNVGRPVGGSLSDYHGMIAPAHVRCDLVELVRVCGLRAWHFNSLPCEQLFFAPFIWRVADSPYIDFANGLDAYFAKRENGRRLKSEYGQKMRKLERDVGPLRFVANVSNHAFLATLIDWKSAQYNRINSPDIFGYAWVRDLLDKLLDYDTEDFSHFLSILYAGDKVASMHFGMRSRTILHGWFPTYNVDLAPYSPGLLHWIETIRAADSIGIDRIDLGRGTEPFKSRLMSGATKVAEGTVDSRASVTAVRRAWWNTRDRFRNSPVVTHARLPVRMFHRVKHWLDVR